MQELIDLYQDNMNAFIRSFESMNHDEFNTKPNEQSWSVGENVEHIYRAEFGITRLFNGETKPSDHNQELTIKVMKERFADRSIRLTAHGPVVPKDDLKDKDELIAKFKRNREEVIKLIQSQDLNEICLMFAHPLFGELTRKEWVHFNMAHANRHIVQIKEVKSALGIV